MKLILLAAIAVTFLFTSTPAVEAGFCCKKKEVCTQEVCRRCYTDVKKCPCRIITKTYREITYVTTYEDCNGCRSTDTWTDTTLIDVKKCRR